MSFLKKHRQPSIDPELVASLAALPAVHPLDIERGNSRVIGTKQASIPVDRIVGSRFSDWSAHGSVKLLPNGNTVPSLAYANDMARTQAYADDSEHPIKLRPFTGEGGELFFRTVDGSHRTLAAKINGEAAVLAQVEIVEGQMDKHHTS